MTRDKSSESSSVMENDRSNSGFLSAENPYLTRLINWGRILVREMIEEGMNYRAMALVYTTLLSLVPLLAVSFSMLKAFGFHNKLQPFLLEILSPLGEQGMDLADKIVGFVENVQVGVLGSLGIVFLIYSAVSLLEIIKDSFNRIWRTNETRTWARRVSNYLSVLLIGPVLVFSALGITASMENNEWVQHIISLEPLGTVYYLIGLFIPYALVVFAFTFIYMFMPSARVNFTSALIGGILGGLGWKVAGWVFATFVTESENYNAIYSGFAIVILFMFWLYVSWLALLIGGIISFYHQHSSYLQYGGTSPELSHKQQEYLGFYLMYLIGKSYYEGKPPCTVITLADAVSLPREVVLETLLMLEKNGLLVSLHSEPESFLPSRAPETFSMWEIYQAVREPEGLSERPMQSMQVPGKVQELLTRMEQSAAVILNDLTLRDWVSDAPLPSSHENE
ncbi:MAG: YhjD/YihY/BrkB family envelope integrity protein [Methylosarcina sp.]